MKARSLRTRRPSCGPGAGCTKPSRVGPLLSWLLGAVEGRQAAIVSCSGAVHKHPVTPKCTSVQHLSITSCRPPSLCAVKRMVLRFVRKIAGLAATVYALTSLTLPFIPHLMVQSEAGGGALLGGEQRALEQVWG